MINFIKKHKNFFLGLFLVLFIFSLFVLIIYFENKDRENIKKTVLSDISYVEDSNNLYKSWSIDSNGNLVGNNLLDINNFVSKNDSISIDNYSIIFQPINNTTYDDIAIQFYGLNFSYLATLGTFGRNSFTSHTFTKISDYHFLAIVRNGNYAQSRIIFNIDSLIDNYQYTVSMFVSASQDFYINNIITTNIMLNEGNTSLDWEPYGVWYSQTNYNNYGNVKYSEGYQVGYNQATNDIYVNNPFYNANVKYYTTLTSRNPWFTFTLNNSLLQNSNTFDVNQAIKTFLSVNEQQDYYDSQDIGYFKVDFAKSFNASEMIYLVNAQSPFQFDHYFTFYFDDGSQYVFHNPITNNSSEYYYQYDVSLANTDKNGMRVVGLSFRRGARDIVNSVSQSQYNIGYNDGYSVGYNKAISNDNDTITSLNNDISDLNSQIESLTYQLNVANDAAQNDLNGLTYTMVSAVMSTPFNILHDMLNFNFFGINVFSLFTSLITLLLLIWVIKFLIGRK